MNLEGSLIDFFRTIAIPFLLTYVFKKMYSFHLENAYDTDIIQVLEKWSRGNRRK